MCPSSHCSSHSSSAALPRKHYGWSLVLDGSSLWEPSLPMHTKQLKQELEASQIHIYFFFWSAFKINFYLVLWVWYKGRGANVRLSFVLRCWHLNPPASASWGLREQACTSTPSSEFQTFIIRKSDLWTEWPASLHYRKQDEAGGHFQCVPLHSCPIAGKKPQADVPIHVYVIRQKKFKLVSSKKPHCFSIPGQARIHIL